MQNNATCTGTPDLTAATEILAKVLTRAGNPAAMRETLCAEVRALAGAQCALVVHCPGVPTGHEHRPLAVQPAEFEHWTESASARQFFKIVHSEPVIREWRPDDSSEGCTLLKEAGFGLSVTAPLNESATRTGALLVLGVPNRERIATLMGELDMLARLLAPVLHGAFQFERQELAIRAYARELEAAHTALREREAEAQRLAQTAERSRRALLDTLEDESRAEAALRESEERYRLIFDTSMDAILLMAPDGRVFAANEAACRLFERTEEEIVRVGRDGLVDANDPRLALTLEERVRQKKYSCELTFVRKDGTAFAGDVSTSTFVDHDGQPRTSMSIRDVTARKQAEEAVLQEQAKLHAIMLAAPVAMLVFDKNACIVEANPTAERTFGRQLPAPGQQRCGDLIRCVHATLHGCNHSKHCPVCPLNVAIQSALDGGPGIQNCDLSAELCTEKGVRRAWYTFSVEPVVFGGDRHAVLALHDISDRVALEAQLLQSQKMESVGRLAGGVAHDFNNMLQVILANTELALNDATLNETLRENLREVQKAGSRSADLTRQLLAFARKQTVAPKVLDPNDTVAGMLKMLRRLIGENIDLAWVPGSNVWPLKMDPAQIDQILANLCVNSRDAIAGVGRVTIQTENVTFNHAYCADHPGAVPGQYVMLAVSDNGRGMNRETQARIFEPFFTTKGLGQGTGLGLATVYGIVKQNDGSIEVYSEVGKGTTFRIYLPRCAEEPSAPETEPVHEIPMAQGETVLIAEDEPAILLLGSRLLKHLGYTVLAAANPDEAIRLADRHDGPIHLLLTDVVMPGMNGRDLADRLATTRPNLKRLYMSGYTADAIAHHGVLEDGVRFVQKPFSVEMLAAKVREALDEE